MATAMLRRNQTDLIPYSAEYTLELNAIKLDADKNNIRKFKFIDEQVQTVPKLLKGFETGTDVYDRMLLFLMTGKDEYKSCMQNWQDGDEAEIEKVFTYDTDNKILASHHNFMKYLQSMPQDMDASMMDEKSVQKILLLPNGEKYKMADESMLTGDIDYKNFFTPRKTDDNIAQRQQTRSYTIPLKSILEKETRGTFHDQNHNPLLFDDAKED